MRTTGLLIVVASIVGAASLSGCSSEWRDDVSVQVTEKEIPAVVKETPVAVEIPTGEVGRGTFVSPDGVTAGEVVISYDGQFTAKLENFSTATKRQMSLMFTDAALRPGDCLWEEYDIAFGLSDEWKTMPMPLHGWEGDPSYFSTAVVGYYPDFESTEGECLEVGSGYAAIKWNLPDLRPNLEVVDSGEQQGARGEVTTEDGKPARYTTAKGDSLAAIASRFAITVDDIAYLNPNRYHARERTEAYEYETLNLSKELRGKRLPDSKLSN